MMDDHLLALNLSDSEPEEAADPNDRANTATTRAERTALSESAFESLKQTYRPKLENGNIYKSISLPLSRSLSKPAVQELVHAAEELYFFRRYAEAASFIAQVLEIDDGGGGGGGGGGGEENGRGGMAGTAKVDGETEKLLRYYLGRCRARLEGEGVSGEGKRER
ncbi:hypothetical protein VTK26DRAFT_3897 [Humicola hyalothermophila]